MAKFTVDQKMKEERTRSEQGSISSQAVLVLAIMMAFLSVQDVGLQSKSKFCTVAYGVDTSVLENSIVDTNNYGGGTRTTCSGEDLPPGVFDEPTALDSGNNGGPLGITQSINEDEFF